VAGTNLAAVHYHFGGLGALLTAAAAEAVERFIDAQIAELGLLPAGATLHEIAGAYFRPMVQALKGPSSKGRAYVRVLARITSDPPDELEGWAETATARAHEALLARLRVVLPGVAEDEMLFRVKCAGGILVLLSVPALEPELQGKSPEQVERMLVPVIAGALAGG
jgi:AcrR family transcriptional regulator